MASFSSSLKGSFVVQGFRVRGGSVGCVMARSLPYGRVGGKRRKQRSPKGGRFDDIDDADDIDDPRTEGRRRKVRAGSGTPEGARKAEGEGCALRRRVVDVVDVVGSSRGERSKGQAAEEG